MPWWVRRLPRRILLLTATLLVVLLALRIWDIRHGPPLAPWHLVVPEELRAEQIDAADWGRYLAAEAAAFATVRTEVTAALEPQDRIPANRYFTGSPLYPGRFVQDWNRSFVLEPEGEARGVVVLLHGLTDSPYSLRHVGALYRDRGWIAIGLRLPAHGTVPAALTRVTWEDWQAATRLAMREAGARAGPDRPLHLIGFSNGGALALKYALDALEDEAMARPDRLVLISPMIGITAFARFAGLTALPAHLPRFAKAAWLGIVPEFIPFKYNSFPVNGARQSHRLTMALQGQMRRLAAEGRLAALPPILTFQSVVDFTFSTRAVITALYDQLPAQGSELVLFDINRNAKLGPLLTPATETALDRLLPPGSRTWRAVVITNASPQEAAVIERVTEAGATQELLRPIGLAWPRDVYSLSHVALPFPVTDGLYGLAPDAEEDFGVQLGALAPRGERGVLAIAPDALLRLSSNPFFPYLLERIGEGMAGEAARQARSQTR
ncbi:carboxylesterase [Falsiroseomonas sp.]|uniref:alpha/beta hydrolase n=1 Tax=Falsiroseomonas sp. TaxID=2870721 RepID=UPI002726F4DC|nr:alpha/beta hydrolase [Falsiroseomonas sp.]MDO9503040.1 alpha/beta hydrolase [Falsiroseomonas sp.]